VVAALEGCGAGEATREQARSYAEQADALLEALPLPDERREQLRTVARYFVDRSS
jgi:geranylgeranyl pyrophosphate synthase